MPPVHACTRASPHVYGMCMVHVHGMRAGMPFLERVEFPDEWLVAEHHNVIHDGWQGNGTLELELCYGKDKAAIRVLPWLAYGCSIGARVFIRKQGAPFGQCATVQRILGDDLPRHLPRISQCISPASRVYLGRCATVQRILGDDRVVARVDGFSKVMAMPCSSMHPLHVCTWASG